MKKAIYFSLVLIFIAAVFIGINLRGIDFEEYVTSVTSPVALREARLLFVGDMMFDRTMRVHGESKGYDYLFSCVSEYLKGFDLVIGNLEGPITAHASYSVGTKPGEVGNTTFTFDPKIAKVLSDHNVKMVNIGNNHIFDFGSEGIKNTESVLDHAGIATFGSPVGSIFATTTVRGINLAFVNYNQFVGQDDPVETVGVILEAKKQSDFVIVYTHWGDEYVAATEYQKNLARTFIDAGADIVIGSHPHIVQEVEMYNGKYIYYSLGNFIFDQYFSTEVRKGGGVLVVARPDSLTMEQVSFDILPDGRTCEAHGS